MADNGYVRDGPLNWASEISADGPQPVLRIVRLSGAGYERGTLGFTNARMFIQVSSYLSAHLHIF